MNSSVFTNNSVSLNRLRFINHLWLFIVLSGGLGILGITWFDLTDSYLSSVEVSQLLATTLIFISWIYCKPTDNLNHLSFTTHLSRYYQPENSPTSNDHELYLTTTQNRMEELKTYHLISQDYIFPFPYLCQIYHLLNLKHLEDIHGFSLNNLKILGVSEMQQTTCGGLMKFQTILESPMNVLRMWRQPIVEVDLILHTPFTVELNIPAYNDKRIIVMFNVIPLGETEHQLFIDIYSNLAWPKPILKAFMHVAACLTVLEDLPYLRKLAQRNLERIVHSQKISSHETMWLFKRFAELHVASNCDRAELAEAA